MATRIFRDTGRIPEGPYGLAEGPPPLASTSPQGRRHEGDRDLRVKTIGVWTQGAGTRD